MGFAIGHFKYGMWTHLHAHSTSVAECFIQCKCHDIQQIDRSLHMLLASEDVVKNHKDCCNHE
jgi:hypothetical protein